MDKELENFPFGGKKSSEAVIVVIGTFLITAVIGIALFPVVLLFDGRDIQQFVGWGYFVILIICMLSINYLLSAVILYPEKEHADFRMRGGVSYKGGWPFVKGATWPYAKISLSPKRLTLHTPWKRYEFDNPKTVSIYKEKFFSIRILSQDSIGSIFVKFHPLPWNYGKLKSNLKKFGFDIKD